MGSRRPRRRYDDVTLRAAGLLIAERVVLQAPDQVPVLYSTYVSRGDLAGQDRIFTLGLAGTEQPCIPDGI